VVQDDGGCLGLPRFPLEGGSIPTSRSRGGSLRIGPTYGVNRLSWTRESRDLKFSRAMSGQSAASAAPLPCREGSTFPHPAGVASFRWSLGLLRCGAQVTAGAFALPFSRRGYRTGGLPFPNPHRGRRRGRSGAAAAEWDALGQTLSLAGPEDPHGSRTATYGGRISWRAVNSLTRRWSAKSFTGAGGVGRQQLGMQLSKNRSD